jgi:hypothetical protein
LAQQDENASKQLAASANWRVLTNVLALGGGGNETLRQAAGSAMQRAGEEVRRALGECDVEQRTWHAVYLLPEVVKDLPIPTAPGVGRAGGWPERRSLARTLGFRGDPRGEATLVALSQDISSFSVRVAAVRALGRLEQLTDVGTAALERAKADSVDRVRVATQQAMEEAGGRGYARVRGLVATLAQHQATSVPPRNDRFGPPERTLAALAESLEDEEDLNWSVGCALRLYHPPEGDWRRGTCGTELETYVGNEVTYVEVASTARGRVELGAHDFELPAGPRNARLLESGGVLILCESGDITLLARNPDRMVWSRCLHDEVQGRPSHTRLGLEMRP